MEIDYKSEIKELFLKLRNMKDWIFVSEVDKIYTFKNSTHYKNECIIDCDPDRIAVMASDISANTRCKWDPYVNRTLTSLEEYKLDDGILNVVGFHGTVGIQWKRKSDKSHLILYRTTKHPIHNGTIDKYNEHMIWLRRIDDKKCFFTFIGLHPYVKIKLMENAKYMEIYSPWECKVCLKKVPAKELECRTCKTERYSRCKNYGCFEAQREGCIKCEHCGTLL
jgi:hypothetical protein